MNECPHDGEVSVFVETFDRGGGCLGEGYRCICGFRTARIIDEVTGQDSTDQFVTGVRESTWAALEAEQAAERDRYEYRDATDEEAAAFSEIFGRPIPNDAIRFGQPKEESEGVG